MTYNSRLIKEKAENSAFTVAVYEVLRRDYSTVSEEGEVRQIILYIDGQLNISEPPLVSDPIVLTETTTGGEKLTLVNFIRRRNPHVPINTAQLIVAAVSKYGAQYGVSPKLLIAQMAQESNFRINAVSPVGAQGLGQIMPATAKDLGVQNPFDPEDNIRGMAKYMGQLLAYRKGDVDLALASYNFGAGGVNKRLKEGRPFPAETRNYVIRIKANLSQL